MVEGRNPNQSKKELTINNILPSQEKEEYSNQLAVQVDSSPSKSGQFSLSPEHDIEEVNHQAEIVSLIWDRDSHGLFDYESKSLVEAKTTQAGSGMLTREGFSIKSIVPFGDEDDGKNDTSQKLGSLVYKHGMYWIYHYKSLFKKGDLSDPLPALDFQHTDQVWQCIRLQNLPYERFMLTESILQMQDRNKKWKGSESLVVVGLGDVVKFGRVRFRVRELHLDTSERDLNRGGLKGKSSKDKVKIHATSQLDSSGHQGADNELGDTGARNLANRLSKQSTNISMASEGQQTVNINDSMDGEAAANFSFVPPKIADDEEEKELQPTTVNPAAAEMAQSEQAICRICLSEEELPDHQLLTPCICSGGMGYIGASCLKEWLEGKKHKKEMPYVNSYIWKGLECEICKTPFKDTYIKPDGSIGDLLNFKRYKNCRNYMVIESVTNTTSKTIHVINFDIVPDVRVGRAQYVEVRITDISVSRYHASLTYQPQFGCVTIEDNFSKFGTLKLVQQPLPIGIAPPVSNIRQMLGLGHANIQEAVYLQIGRAVVGIRSVPYNQSIINKIGSCLKCCIKKKPDKKRTKRIVENLLHYEEAVRNFPQEYLEFFVNLGLIEPQLIKTLNFKPLQSKIKGGKGDSDPIENLVQHTQNDTLNEQAQALGSIHSRSEYEDDSPDSPAVVINAADASVVNSRQNQELEDVEEDYQSLSESENNERLNYGAQESGVYVVQAQDVIPNETQVDQQEEQKEPNQLDQSPRQFAPSTVARGRQMTGVGLNNPQFKQAAVASSTNTALLHNSTIGAPLPTVTAEIDSRLSHQPEVLGGTQQVANKLNGNAQSIVGLGNLQKVANQLQVAVDADEDEQMSRFQKDSNIHLQSNTNHVGTQDIPEVNQEHDQAADDEVELINQQPSHNQTGLQIDEEKTGTDQFESPQIKSRLAKTALEVEPIEEHKQEE